MPFQAWLCDVCGKPVTSESGEGIVTWRTDRAAGSLEDYDFKLVHKTIDSDPEPKRCDPGNAQGFYGSLDLEKFVGADGLAMLLSWLSAGPIIGSGQASRVKDIDEFVDLIRRVQTPYYEEARLRFDESAVRERLDDSNEYYPYLPATLRSIAEAPLPAE